MKFTPSTVPHEHIPLYRVIRKGWTDPLETSFSQRKTADNRWNTPEFPALYTSCSERVARFIVRDLLKLSSIEIEDLQEPMRPQLVEISWAGSVVDMVSPNGLAAAGFQEDYPVGVDRSQTRVAASDWQKTTVEGVVARSASLMRFGFRNWTGDHKEWSELAIFVTNSSRLPVVIRRRADIDWLLPLTFAEPEGS